VSATTQPTPEQVQRAKWDLMLLDIEHRTEQLRQLKSFGPWQFIATLSTACVIAGGAGAGALLWVAQHIH
jgi:hypothetical protein